MSTSQLLKRVGVVQLLIVMEMVGYVESGLRMQVAVCSSVVETTLGVRSLCCCQGCHA
jgi:hypothetical protein